MASIPKEIAPIRWAQSGTNKISRIVAKSPFELKDIDNSKYNVAVSANFWERIVIFNEDSIFEKREYRKILGKILRLMIANLTTNLVIRNFGLTSHTKDLSKISLSLTQEEIDFLKTNLKNKKINILVSMSAFSRNDYEAFQREISKYLPNVNTELISNPTIMLERIHNKNFDIALLLYSYGPSDSYPSLSYYGNFYFGDKFKVLYLSLLEKILHSKSLEERNSNLETVGNLLENDYRLISLGGLPSAYIFSKAVTAESSKLISGELKFSAFRSK